MKQVLMIAGPNGAGKTTAAMTLLPKYLSIFEFVNADEIARGLNPLQPEAQAVSAARVMLERIDDLINAGKNFGFESTGAGLNQLQILKKCKTEGYEVKLAFLWLPSAEMAVKRVAQRVKNGGHSIPPEVIERRYHKGLHNLITHYLPIADVATIYDNSKDKRYAVAKKTVSEGLHILNSTAWQTILESAHAT